MRDSLVLLPQELDQSMRNTWNDLLADSPVPSAFLSHTYAKAAGEAFCNVRVCVIRDDARPVAFFAFSCKAGSERLLGAARPVGGNFSDYVGLVAAAGFSTSPEELLHACKLNTLLFTHLDESQQSLGLGGEQPGKGLRIRTGADGNFIAELAERDKKFFQDTERRYRKLERDHGPLRFAVEVPTSPMLDWLIDTKIAQYRRTGRTTHPFAQTADRVFLHALAAQDDELCRPRLTTLYCDEKPIAAHFGLQCADTLAYWFPVYDTAFHTYSPGRLLMWETLKCAAELGLRCVDRGEGDTQAKRDFANEEHQYFRGYYARKNLAAFVDQGLNSLRWRLEARRAKPAGD
jgi:CelD/BcsL family acetyltransferase involved in cellulose biosynthesis